jgi:hypothetical protein
LVVGHIASKQAPQSVLHAGTDFGHKAFKNGDARQQHFGAEKPASGMLE